MNERMNKRQRKMQKGGRWSKLQNRAILFEDLRLLHRQLIIPHTVIYTETEKNTNEKYLVLSRQLKQIENKLTSHMRITDRGREK